ncbi:hypothetical protein RB195_022263 [Necator americanus]|uniref:Uncharacterized protein n=1 Tax=Necator americanus TaxID=51031 RepID=A0ABR1EEV4_NECAM
MSETPYTKQKKREKDCTSERAMPQQERTDVGESPSCRIHPRENGKQVVPKAELQEHSDSLPIRAPLENQKIAVTILARESDVLARKTLEAFSITAKSPIMNRKEECIDMTSELAPYQDLSLKAAYLDFGVVCSSQQKRGVWVAACETQHGSAHL